MGLPPPQYDAYMTDACAVQRAHANRQTPPCHLLCNPARRRSAGWHGHAAWARRHNFGRENGLKERANNKAAKGARCSRLLGPPSLQVVPIFAPFTPASEGLVQAASLTQRGNRGFLWIPSAWRAPPGTGSCCAPDGRGFGTGVRWAASGTWERGALALKGGTQRTTAQAAQAARPTVSSCGVLVTHTASGGGCCVAGQAASPARMLGPLQQEQL